MKKLLLLSLAITGFSAQAQFWTPKATTFTTVSRGVNDISIVDDNVVWVKAYDGSGGADQTVKQYARSVDGGNTWTSGNINLGLGTGFASLGIGGISAVSATTAWVAAYPNASTLGGIWKTENGGTLWTKQPTALFSGSDSFANLVYFWNANEGFCQGDPDGGYFELYTTTNGGTNWVRVPQANIPAMLAGEYGYVHNYETIGNTIWMGTNKGRLFKSLDKGMNWTVAQTPLTDFAGTASAGTYTFSDQNKGMIANSTTGKLYSTQDGGANWTMLPAVGVYFTDIAYVPGTSTVVANGTADISYGSYYSYDDGATWNVAEEGTQFTVLAIRNAMTAFAGGFTTSASAGGIYKYTGTALKTANFNMGELKLYPNPTNGLVTITSGVALTNVEIYDFLGKRVVAQSFSSVNEAAIDMSNLSSGAYIVKATAENGAVQTMKLMKN